LLVAVAALGAAALRHWQHDAVMRLMLAGGAIYAAACWLTLRLERTAGPGAQRRALLVVLAAGICARLLLIGAPPVSTDIYRYVWDGRVQAAGINPYRFRPAEPPVAFLRDATVYPQINRAATAVTIYPPLAQMIFFTVTRVANSVTGMKAAMAAFDLATMGALLALLRSHGVAESRLVFYAWNPLPLFEFAGSGHIDAAAIALMLLACLAARGNRPAGAGVLLGAAALVKFFPLVIAPALYRRWGWRLPAALAATVAVLYLPYLGVGRQVFGFLPGYIREEGLASGSGFFLLNALSAAFPLPTWGTAAYLAGGAVLLAGLAWIVVMRPDPAVSLTGALLLLAVFTLWMSPHLAWYFTWCLPFLCFKPSWALIYLSVAAPLLYDIIWSPGALPLHAALYVPCALIFAAESWWRSRRPPVELSNDRPIGTRPAG
jgi:hypothetical protein